MIKNLVFALLLPLSLLSCQQSSAPVEDTRLASSSELAQSISNETALHALSEAYVDGWKQADTAVQKAAVMPLFAQNAVVIPSGGRFILSGHEDIEGFWFPEGAAPTRVLLFDHYVEAVSVSGNQGTFHGVSKLQFEYEDVSKYQEAVFLAVARKSESGMWQFTHFTWTDKPS